jgi:ATP-dependent Clp protease ATP-binding subunit ClpA
MLEPSDDLEGIFERSVQLAIDLKHQYVTLEHFLLALISDNNFGKTLKDFGADVPGIKSNIEKYVNTQLSDIIDPTLKSKPKKTHSIERMLNRAFTQTLFAGRTTIEPVDCFISMLHEKKSHAMYFLKQAGVEKEKFIEFMNNEVVVS